MDINVGENGKLDDSVHEEMYDSVKIDSEVREIFDGIFDEPMKKFNQPLNVIIENQFELVWREENERHDKIMSCAKSFIQALTTSFSSVHAKKAEHIEGSTCDVFLIYVREKLSNSVLGQHRFEHSCNEIKDLITRRVLKIKETLEMKHDEQPENKSDLEIMIQQTDLFDPIHIYHALLCCQIAYDCKDPEHLDITLEKLEKEHLLRELAVSYENESVPKYVMARCGDVLYVSFKGMQSHNFIRTEVSHRGEICAGISEEAKKIPLKYFAREIIQNKRVVFSVGSSEETFTKTGFRARKKASGESGKLANHAKTQMHILSMERMQNFKSDNQHIDVQFVGIAEALKTRKEQEREENRQIFQTIFDVVRHLANQNTAFRGHDETNDLANRGNFLEELFLLAKYDKPLKR